MDTTRLLHKLSSIHPISTPFIKAIEAELIFLSLPKNHLLVEATNVADKVCFLDSGFAMTYTFANGGKHVDTLWKPGQIIMSPRSFFEQVPSREFVQLIEQSNLLCVNYAGVQKLFNAFAEAGHIYRVVMTECFDYAKEQLRDLQLLTAVERYEKFLTNFPSIEQIISQEHIASYLGITPQSLSRIKRQMGRN